MELNININIQYSFLGLFKAFKNAKESSRVIDGSEVSNPIPWMVQLLDFVNVHICGGVLLSDRYILSAAHCYINDRFSSYVVIGVTFRRTLDNFQETNILKQKTSIQPILHPRHERFISPEISITIYDLMVLILETPLKNNCPQNYARLPDKDFWINQKLILNGWGNTHELTHEEIIESNKGELDLVQTYPINLQQVSLSYIPYHVCQKRYQNFLDRNKKTKGRKTLFINGKLINGKYTGHTLNSITFGKGLGLSMICTSSCPAEDLRQCPHQHKTWESACFGDSGCKFLREIFNAQIVIFYFDVNPKFVCYYNIKPLKLFVY